jgi:hypothetical protein
MNHSTLSSPLPALAAGVMLALSLNSAAGQSVVQSITLQPGWNAVHLEVLPEDNSADAVFAALPAGSVWTRTERLSSADFIQNASEQNFNSAEWLRWFPSSRPESFLNNLFAVFPNRAYLIHITNASPVPWNITGRPSLREVAWVPDAYNLRGVPVDPVSPPTFLNFFRHSRAHFNSTNSQLEKIYRLNGSGQWAQVSPNDLTKAGEAYWIFTRGASDYLAPLNVQLELGDGLDFGMDLTELILQFRNVTTTPATVSVRDLINPGNNPLSYRTLNPIAGVQWPSLPNPLSLSTPGGAAARARIAVRRQDLSGNTYGSVLEVRNGAGTRILIPVSAERFTGSDTTGARLAGLVESAEAFAPLAGLWVGSADIGAVSEVNSSNPTNPTPARARMNLRLVIHVSADGQTRLLKEVIQMWRDGTTTNDVNGVAVVDKPGRFVLLTDDSLIASFAGATVRDGRPVGRRLSTVGYDFPATGSVNHLDLNGTFATNETLSATLTLPFDHPNNPFLHKYHPDHDNMNVRFDGPAVESYAVARQLELELTASPPAGPESPDYGFDEVGGNYREIITGLHKTPIHVSGTFRLRRTSYIAELNPSATP